MKYLTKMGKTMPQGKLLWRTMPKGKHSPYQNPPKEDFNNYYTLNFKCSDYFYLIFLVLARLCVLHKIINRYNSKE